MGVNWYIAQFKPKAHGLATRNLERQGFSVFLPMHEVTKRRNGQFRKAVTPLFPGYLFVEFDPLVRGWRAINSTLGISRLVSFCDRPAVVPETLITGLKMRCGEAEQVLPLSTFKEGDKVEIAHGPFAGFIATIDRMSPDQRVWVLLELMQQETRVQVGAGNLALAG